MEREKSSDVSFARHFARNPQLLLRRPFNADAGGVLGEQGPPFGVGTR
jgi:hypothetical protein